MRRKGRLAVQYVLVFVGCVLVLDALVGDKGLLEMLKKRQEYRALEQSLSDVRGENTRLRDEARRLQEDPATIEDLASFLSIDSATCIKTLVVEGEEAGALVALVLRGDHQLNTIKAESSD